MRNLYWCCRTFNNALFGTLFKLSYGMCILSSKEDDKINGCIVNTVFQLTPDPPVVAVSVNKQCLTHQFIS